MLIAMLVFLSLFLYLQTSPILHALLFFLLVMPVVVPKLQSVESRSTGSQHSVGSRYHTGLSSNGIK